MATYGDLKDTIADDLVTGAAVTEAQIERAIATAIADYESRRFWFNESRSLTFNTVDGQSDYTSSDDADIGNLVHVDLMMIGERRLLHADPDQVDWWLAQDTALSGEPTYWSMRNGTIRLYSIPDAVYTVRITGHIKFAALSADADTNVWTTEAFDLIRSRAKWEIAANITKDAEEGQRAAAAEERALAALTRGTAQRTARGFIWPAQF